MKNEIRLIVTILLIYGIFSTGCSKTGEGGDNQAHNATKPITESASNAESQHFNKSGMEFYKKREYQLAVEEFKKAINSDPEHKLANYNLACTYALMFDECEVFPRESDIFNQLKKAADLDPSVRTKALKDSDFKKFNKSTRFFAALNLLPKKEDNEGWKNILIGTESWNIGNCGGGVYSTQCDGIIFNKNGTFIKNVVNSECMSAPDDEKACKNFDMSDPYIKQTGKYEIKNQKAILKFDSGKTEEMSLPIPEHDSEPCGA